MPRRHLTLANLDAWTKDDARRVVDEIDREQAYVSFAEFCQRMAPIADQKYRASPMVWGRHMDLVCDEIEAVLNESDRRRAIHASIMASKISKDEKARRVNEELGILPRLRLVILIPPRNSKSTIVAKLLPCWRWLHRAQDQFLTLTSADTLIARDGMAVRDVLESDEYKAMQARLVRSARLPAGGKEVDKGQSFQLRKDQFAKEKFTTTAAGGRAGHVLGAGYTGVDSDITVIDDPHDIDDGLKDTVSPAVRLRLMNEIRSTYKDKVQDRLNEPIFGVIILIMQRVHPKDLADYMIETGAKVLCLPSEFNPVHPLRYREGMGYVATAKDWRTMPGEVLNPLRFPKAELDRKRAESPHGYATKELMEPTVQEGVLYRREWFKRRFGLASVDPKAMPGGGETEGGWLYEAHRLAEMMEEVAISVDAAEKTGPKNDFTSMQVWGRRGSKRVLLDRRYGKWTYPALRQQFENLVQEWPEATLKFIEDKSNGTNLCDDYEEVYTGIVRVQPQGDKASRSSYAEPVFEAGNAWIPNAPWAEEYIENMVGFGAGGMHDDDVDATSQIFKRWAQRSGPWLTSVQRSEIGERAGPGLAVGAAVRWGQRDVKQHYYVGLVPGWANGGSAAVASIVDGRGFQVALVECRNGGVDGFVSALAMECEYWRTVSGGRYAEVDGGPYEETVRALTRQKVRIGGTLTKMVGERKAGYRGTRPECAKLWGSFMAMIAEGRVSVFDQITMTMLGTVIEDNGMPRMADGTAVGGRVLALLLAVEALRGVPLDTAGVVGMQYGSKTVEAKADLWSLNRGR